MYLSKGDTLLAIQDNVPDKTVAHKVSMFLSKKLYIWISSQPHPLAFTLVAPICRVGSQEALQEGSPLLKDTGLGLKPNQSSPVHLSH